MGRMAKLWGGLAGAGLAATAAFMITIGGDPSVVTWMDTSNNCADQPNIRRAFGVQTMEWKGSSFLFVNHSNEVGIYRDPSPTIVDITSWAPNPVPYPGDGDYNLQNVAVCDDCRYGLASYKTGTVLFDLGTGPAPRFTDMRFISDAHYVYGGATFKHNGEEFLIAAQVTDDCPGSGLYRFVSHNALSFISCVQAPGIPMVQIVSGKAISVDSERTALYLVDKSRRVMNYQVRNTGPAVEIEYLATITTGYSIKGHCLDIDGDWMVTANESTGLTVWDISDPLSPRNVTSVDGDWSRATISYPWVMAARKTFSNTEVTYTFDGNALTPAANWVWDPEEEWNYGGHPCVAIEDAVFSSDGSVLHRAMFAVGQTMDTASWGPDPTPTPDPSFIFGDGFESGDTSEWSRSSS